MYEIGIELSNINNTEKENMIKKTSELLARKDVKGHYNIWKTKEDEDEN